MQADRWLLRRRGSQARMRLFCFSYAGGSAVRFLEWQSALPSTVELCAVQLPGRGARFGEAPLHELTALVQALAPVIGEQSDLPFAFFGHSLGALIAFELARHCQRQRLPMPEHLFVSGCSAPSRRRSRQALHALDDEALIAALRDYNGTPQALLADRELMALLLPAIRADFSIVENYVYREAEPLDIPITVMCGRNDPHVAPQHVACWEKETAERCSLHWFAGDHFFIHAQERQVIDCIAGELAEVQLA